MMKPALAAALALALQSGGELDREIESVLPRPEEERWLRVPWELNLMRGRAEAQKAGKPLLVWIMDGHVLGST